MQQIKAAIIIAIACCFLSANSPTIALPQRSTFELELTVTRLSSHKAADVIVIVRLGKHETGIPSINEPRLTIPAQYFNSWREKTMEILCKSMHMA
jgi:hypothetical protein